MVLNISTIGVKSINPRLGAKNSIKYIPDWKIGRQSLILNISMIGRQCLYKNIHDFHYSFKFPFKYIHKWAPKESIKYISDREPKNVKNMSMIGHQNLE